MELRQLAYFEAVARCGSFTRAAERLHIAQPAVSAQIRRLERELGTSLLARTTRRVSLTQAGELFLARAQAVLAELDGARADLSELAAVLRGQLRLGVTPVTGSLDVPVALAGFHRRYPDIGLSVRNGLIAALLQDLDDGDIDAVIGPVHHDLDARYVARSLVGESFVLVTPPGRRSTAPAIRTLGDVRDDLFVCLPAASGLHAILIEASAAQGFVPHIQFEAPDPAGIRAFVSAGLGVALLAGSAARADGPPVDIHRLKPSPRHPPIGLITTRGRRATPTLRAWQQHLEQERQPRVAVGVTRGRKAASVRG
ncbi:MAG: LysR family transcriptional regulator [Pseudonocardiales bacterium]